MRGYFSFLVAAGLALLLLSLLELRAEASSSDLSLALSFERAYGAEMDAKQAAAESMRQGARSGFEGYDSSHSLEGCRHCPDAFCAPDPIPGLPAPAACDAVLCTTCFREDEARAAAQEGASSRIRGLALSDGDFEASFGSVLPEASLMAEPGSRNGFALGFIRLREPLSIRVSSVRFGFSASSALPKGMVVR